MPLAQAAEVHFTTAREFRNEAGELFRFAPGSRLAGDLELQTSDGPLDSREYQLPSFLAVTFSFTYEGKLRRYHNWLNRFNLWMDDGAAVETECPSFVSHSGQIEDVMDGREDLTYVRPNGQRFVLRVKYISCWFDVMVASPDLLIRCRHFNPGAASEAESQLTVYFRRPLERLLFLPAPILYRDEEGQVEDYNVPSDGFVAVD